jgi:beta-mannosidase
MLRIHVSALFCALCAPTSLGAADRQDFGELPAISLSGADWRIHDDADGKGAKRGMPEAESSSSGWTVATVPGNIQADLEAAHQFKPLWYGAGDPRLADAAQKNWWYRKDFPVPKTFDGRRATLVFDGVDHECEVWLNGEWLGGNAGMFKRFWLDATKAVRPGQINRLAVKIARIPPELVAAVASADAKNGANVCIASNLIRQRLKELKSPTNSAYDWSVAIYTLGIWKDVRLEATGSARITWTRVQTELKENCSKAIVRVHLDVDSLTDLKARAGFSVVGHGASAAKTVEVRLARRANAVEAELSVEHPALWWPNGQGGQPLYCCKVTLADAESKVRLDERAVRFGIREIRWEQVPGAPADFVNPLKLVVNGRPVRQMGSNLTPPDALFGRIGQRGPRLLALAREAGINCLRLNGVGVVLPEGMYDLADELGIMLLAEFPLGNCIPESDLVFLKNLEETARNIIAQTRNHPCVVEWTGGNELVWKNGDDHPALHVLEKVVHEDDGRIFRATEAAQGSGAHGTYTYAYHTVPAPQIGWLGAGNRNLYQRYNDTQGQQMRLSEFGTNSPANLEVWHREIPPASQWPLRNIEDPILIRKNVFYGCVPTNWLHKDLTEQVFGELDGLASLVQAGQFLGGEGLRYAMDALRRNGPALGGGFMSWNYNEPWPNGAGSYMVDYDGRPLMNYDFVKQALAPVSLSLRYDSLLYDPLAGVRAELYCTSDAPGVVRGLRWRWLGRDRRGRVCAENKGEIVAIGSQEVQKLGAVTWMPPTETASGPLLVEMQLLDSAGKLLTERIHIFGSAKSSRPLAGLIQGGLPDINDTLPEPADRGERPDGPGNLAFVGNGAKPAAASSARPESIHQPAGLNDGRYGNDHSWVGADATPSFTIDLGRISRVGRFKFGRDRMGVQEDRFVGSLKIEVSTDGKHWSTVFERAELPAATAAQTIQIAIAPASARWIRGTVGPSQSCIDEFEVYAPRPATEGPLPQVTFAAGRSNVACSVTPTRVQAAVGQLRTENGQEVLELAVKNTGRMTALFCEPHPLIAYRTDLFIENNHCFIPPGESRTITIKSASNPRGGLSLAQTGWRLATWNANDVTIEPSDEVLFAVGRRDQMCREFLGYSDVRKMDNVKHANIEGTRPDPSRLPFLLDGKKRARFEFPLSDGQARRAARLRIHTADQSKSVRAMVEATVNGTVLEQTLPEGLGIQNTDPAHLAFPATLVFQLPHGTLLPGKNVVEVRVRNEGWFSWDAMDLITSTRSDSHVP